MKQAKRQDFYPPGPRLLSADDQVTSSAEIAWVAERKEKNDMATLTVDRRSGEIVAPKNYTAISNGAKENAGTPST